MDEGWMMDGLEGILWLDVQKLSGELFASLSAGTTRMYK